MALRRGGYDTFADITLRNVSLILAGAFLFMAVASGAGACESSTEFQAIGKKYIGTWSGSGTYSTGYPGACKKREINLLVSEPVDGLQVSRPFYAKVL
jgi:hypothetical protein